MIKSAEVASLQAEKFLNSLTVALETARGTYGYDACLRDAREKTSPQDSSGYVSWLRRLLTVLSGQPNVSGKRLLDVGCGSGALTVLMKLMGYDAVGLDVDEAQINLARTLADENGCSRDMFICDQSPTLPFRDASFDLVTMISVVEHVDDSKLNGLAQELARICKGALFVQAPNSAAVRDDHTGLLFVPWMPHWLAKHYIRSRGDRYEYRISRSGTWDVYYRRFEELLSFFDPYFDWQFAPADCSYPPPPKDYVPTRVGKRVRISGREVFVGLPLPWRQFRVSRGHPKEAYFPYVNLIFTPKNGSR